MNSVLFVGKAIKPYSVNTQELFAPICQSIYQCSHMPNISDNVSGMQNDHICQMGE